MIFFRVGDRVISTVDGRHGVVQGQTTNGTCLIQLDFLFRPGPLGEGQERSFSCARISWSRRAPLDFLVRAARPDAP